MGVCVWGGWVGEAWAAHAEGSLHTTVTVTHPPRATFFHCCQMRGRWIAALPQWTLVALVVSSLVRQMGARVAAWDLGASPARAVPRALPQA